MIVKEKLDNGITIVMERVEHVYSVGVGVYVKCGSAYEDVTNNGISHMIEHMMFKGTTTKSSNQIAEIISDLGDDVNAYTAKEITCYYGRVLSEDIRCFLDLISDMMLHSVFDEKELNKERQVIIEENNMYNDSPEDLACESVSTAAYGDHPLGYVISGPNSNVKTIKREDLVSWKEKYYVAENTVISVSGCFEFDEMKELLNHYFGCMKKGSCANILSVPEFHNQKKMIGKHIDQAHLCMGFPDRKVDWKCGTISALANNHFGASSDSVLFAKIREEKGLAYTIYGYNVACSVSGLYQIYAATSYQYMKEVKENILACREQFRNEGMKLDQLNRMKKQMKINRLIGNENHMELMHYNAKSVIYHQEILSPEQIMSYIDSVKLDEVNEYIYHYYQNETMVSVYVGDGRRIKC